MAKMYPTKIPSDVLSDRKRSAEIKVYNLLSEQLSDKFVCYYSRPWHQFKDDGFEQDGEADFVIANADLGILVIEVKGGRISCRESDEQWLSKDRYDISFKIKNPVAQARSSKHNILKLLKDSKDWQPRFINMFHGVILPDSSRPQRALAADAPLEMFAFGDDLANLGDWVVSRFNSETDAASLGVDGMGALHKLLSSKFELRPHLARAISDDIKSIERLTADQFLILEELEDNRQMAVSGAAGTGKTILALEKAMRVASPKHRTLLVCYNGPLAAKLKTIVGDTEYLVVTSFHSLCRTVALKAGVEVPNESAVGFYSKVLPEKLLEAVEKQPDLKFDSIVIDEGQDFSDDWLDVLRFTLKSFDESLFYVFYDDNQRIFSGEKLFLDALPQARFRLSRNLRNTKAIHRSLTPWYAGKKTIAVGPAGEDVKWEVCRDDQQVFAKASVIVSNLLKSNQLKAQDIAILSGRAQGDCKLFQKGVLSGCKIIPVGEVFGGDSIVGDTVRRYKGLEAKCVILVDISYLTEPELIYVALSRPAVLLYVLGAEDDLKRLQVV